MARGKAKTVSERISVVSQALLKAQNKVLDLQEEYEALLDEKRLEEANQILELANRTGLSTNQIEEIVIEHINGQSSAAATED